MFISNGWLRYLNFVYITTTIAQCHMPIGLQNIYILKAILSHVTINFQLANCWSLLSKHWINENTWFFFLLAIVWLKLLITGEKVTTKLIMFQLHGLLKLTKQTTGSMQSLLSFFLSSSFFLLLSFFLSSSFFFLLSPSLFNIT